MFICFNLKFIFSCGLPTWRLIPDQFKWCSAAAANVAFVVSDCRYSPVPRGCVASRACTSVWLDPGFCHGWVEGKRAVVVDEGWNGKCSRNEMSLYPLSTNLYAGRGYASSWCTVIKQWTYVGFVEADEGRGRGAIGWGEDRVQFKEAMTGKCGDSTEVRSEGESQR